MLGQHLRIPLPQRLDQARRPLDIAEQERDRPARKPAHPAAPQPIVAQPDSTTQPSRAATTSARDAPGSRPSPRRAARTTPAGPSRHPEPRSNPSRAKSPPSLGQTDGETRVGSRIWINRTTDLINRIGAARGHALSHDQVAAAAHEGTVPATVPAPTVTAEDAFELSERELEVARLVASGLSNPAIASALFISVATVKTHVSHILAKLSLDSRAAGELGRGPRPRRPAPARG